MYLQLLLLEFKIYRPNQHALRLVQFCFSREHYFSFIGLIPSALLRGSSLSQGSYQGGPMPGLYLLHQKESYLSTHAMVAPTVGLFFNVKYKRTNALPVAQTIECHSLHSWTPEKPDARLAALEESASPAWLAAPSTSRDPNKKYI